MSFTSNANHRKPYLSSPLEKQRLADIEILLDAIRSLPIEEPVKKRIWSTLSGKLRLPLGTPKAASWGAIGARRS
jgi:hypothetical protein